MIRRRRFQHKANIDMTSLMDLTFMLLIVFIVTVPVMDYSTDVVVPSMNTLKEMERDNQNIVRVDLDNSGQYRIYGTPVQPAQLEEQFAILKAQGKQYVTIRADRNRPYEEIIAVLRAGIHAGLNMALMTSQE